MNAVSGATGFLGAHMVCYLLSKGEHTRALKREGSSMTEFNRIFNAYFGEPEQAKKEELLSRLEWKKADILDIPALEEALEGVTRVYHCAAVVSFLQKHRDRLMKVNIEGTANMVNAALLKGVKSFCHVSSIAALGRVKDGQQMDENTKWVDSPQNSKYAVSKYLAELEVWRGMEEGLHVVVVNPGVILGVGNWNKGSCKLFDLPWKNFPFFTTGVNGYVDVRDVAKAMFQLMHDPSAFSKRYILVSDNVSMKWFMETIATRFNRAKPKIRVRPWMASLAWILFAIKQLLTGKEAAITRETSRTSVNHYYYNNSRVKEQLNFTFIPIEETLSYICTNFLKDHQS